MILAILEAQTQYQRLLALRDQDVLVQPGGPGYLGLLCWETLGPLQRRFGVPFGLI